MTRAAPERPATGAAVERPVTHSCERANVAQGLADYRQHIANNPAAVRAERRSVAAESKRCAIGAFRLCCATLNANGLFEIDAD
jgi:hypothetical protein